jgi:hypothetical protein
VAAERRRTGLRHAVVSLFISRRRRPRWLTTSAVAGNCAPVAVRPTSGSRGLTFDRLDCARIREVYLIRVRFDGTPFKIDHMIELIFRRHDLGSRNPR